jgi:uncharacterized protein YdhG (YjbR/CyaY superfamily)
VFPGLADELAGFEKSSEALRFPVDQPLAAELVNKLIAVRLRLHLRIYLKFAPQREVVGDPPGQFAVCCRRG